MNHCRAPHALLVVLCCLIGLGAIRGQAPPPRLTPGGAAALVLPKGPWDRDRLTSAIADADPQVRTVAARVAAMQIRTDLGSALAAALAQEQDRSAASEQARAILLLQRNAAVTAAGTAARRLGGPVVAIVAEWLARNSPKEFSTLLPGLVKSLAEEEDLSGIGRMAVMVIQQTPADQDPVTQAVLDIGRPESWRNYLHALAGNGLDTAGPLGRGVSAADPRLRAVSWWFLLAFPAVADGLKPALSTALGADAAQELPWSLAGRELTARRLGKSSPVDQSAVFKEHLPEVRRERETLVRLLELTAAERLTLRSILGDSYPAEPPAPSTPTPARPRVVTARNVTQFVPGLLKSVFAVTGCKTSGNNDVVTGARIFYRADGRPREIAVDAARVSAGCGEALRILANLSVAERDEVVTPDRPVWVILPLETSIVACIDEPPVERVERISNGRIEAPRKIKNVNPQYPPTAQQAGIQGVVGLEALISPAGCVRNAAVTRSVDLALDIESLRTVTQWRFTPTLLGGQPVPVIMTVTVNYTLK